MINDFFQQFIRFAQHNGITFILIIMAVFIAIFLLTILLLKPTKQIPSLRDKTIQKAHEIATPLQKAQGLAMTELGDIHAIAGDDVLVTQLDLARAYIELGNRKLAKKILENVMHQGNDPQKHAAQTLLSTL